jgi:hypothetical protein
MSRLILIYSLLVSLWVALPAKPATAQGDIPASVALCEDGRQVVGYVIVLEGLPSDAAIRLTAVSNTDFDPAIAVLEADGDVTCTNNSASAEGTTIAVPGLGRVEANAFAAQTTVTAGARREIRAVVGGFAGQSGVFALVIENLRLDRPNEADTMEIYLPPSATKEWLNVFMIGADEDLDPALAMYIGDSVRASQTCDNAGTPTCPGVPDLLDRGAVINTEETYSGDAFDAGVIGAFGEEYLTYEFSDATGNNTGEYVAIISALAPGAVLDTSFICENVAFEVRGASPSYNTTYLSEYILDGDPSTFWVTGAAPLDPQTNARTNTSFIVIGIEGDRPISKIRINGYAQASQEFATNALRLFAVRFQNENEEVVTAVEGELLQQPGYQSYSFLPAQIGEIGLILIDNYGGTLFTVVDVQICAQP